uniref:Uncharacterized protein n=1 Tax=Arundo donax TaxID=35708 RepID=A0A0A9A3I8_ARUDO
MEQEKQNLKQMTTIQLACPCNNQNALHTGHNDKPSISFKKLGFRDFNDVTSQQHLLVNITSSACHSPLKKNSALMPTALRHMNVPMFHKSK